MGFRADEVGKYRPSGHKNRPFIAIKSRFSKKTAGGFLVLSVRCRWRCSCKVGIMESQSDTNELGAPKLLDRVRSAIRLRHYSPRTEEAYVGWIRRFVIFHKKRHPTEMGDAEVRQFLTHLVEEKNVSASTQNQALNALAFLYRHVLQSPLGKLEPFVLAKRPKNLPIVLTKTRSRKYAFESATCRAFEWDRCHGPWPLPAVLSASFPRTPN